MKRRERAARDFCLGGEGTVFILCTTIYSVTKDDGHMAPALVAAVAAIALARFASALPTAAITLKPGAPVGVSIPPPVGATEQSYTLVSSMGSGQWGGNFKLTRRGSKLVGSAVTPLRTGIFGALESTHLRLRLRENKS